jgi:hypothetical protein
MTAKTANNLNINAYIVQLLSIQYAEGLQSSYIWVHNSCSTLILLIYILI